MRYAMFPIEHIMCSIHTLVLLCGSALPLQEMVIFYFFILPKQSFLALLPSCLSRPIGIEIHWIQSMH